MYKFLEGMTKISLKNGQEVVICKNGIGYFYQLLYAIYSGNVAGYGPALLPFVVVDDEDEQKAIEKKAAIIKEAPIIELIRRVCSYNFDGNPNPPMGEAGEGQQDAQSAKERLDSAETSLEYIVNAVMYHTGRAKEDVLKNAFYSDALSFLEYIKRQREVNVMDMAAGSRGDLERYFKELNGARPLTVADIDDDDEEWDGDTIN